MKPYRHYPIFMLGYLFSISDAAVTITTTDSLNSAEYLECNSAVTLTCTTTPANPTTLIWEVNGVRASDCLLATCTNYGTYPANYAFTDDLSSGTFTLKMDPLIFTDDGTVISCTDGSDTVTFKPDVKVLAESGNTTISSTADSSGTNITIATGCVYPPEKITFTWNYVKSGKTAEAYTTTSPSAITTDGTGCSTGDCGGTGVEKVSQTLTIVEDTNGEEYSFQVVVNHADATGHDFTVTTIGTYKIAVCDDTCTLVWLILTVIAGVIMIIVIILISKYTGFADRLQTVVKVLIGLGVIVVYGIIIALAIIEHVNCTNNACDDRLSTAAIVLIALGSIEGVVIVALVAYRIYSITGWCNSRILPKGICGDADAHGNSTVDGTQATTAHTNRREESDSVSKQDVILERRPMPAIPNNNKTREDGNSITTVNFPAASKPKNTLEPLVQSVTETDDGETRKKKKKKKKAKNDASDTQRTEDGEE